ncbi:MAG: TetR/AcrR family transcriptional regulator [Clostridiales Family XIII bacterium]|nr:TetR/AcrR family transcriptional regulator [Clostridiales Family XIII bacterium]
MDETREAYASELFLRIAEEKRERILNIAVKEFATNGYADANVNDIAEMAGVSVGALYKYFATKEDLFLYIVAVAEAMMAQQVREIVDADIRFLSKIERLLLLARDYSRSNPNLITLYSVFTAENDDKRAELIAGKIEGITAEAYTRLIAKAQENGEIRDDIDAGILAWLLDNQLISMQFSFACSYYRKRFSLFLGERNAGDNEYVIRNVMKTLQSMFGIE